MATKYIQLPYPWLKSWLGTFDASVISFLESEGKKLMTLFSNHFYQAKPEFVDVFLDDTLAVEQWPKYINKKIGVELGGKKIGEIFLDYCYWNPRDGESWSLMLALWMPGEKNYANLSVKYNMSEPHFDFSFEDEHPEAEAQIIEMLDKYDSGSGKKDAQ